MFHVKHLYIWRAGRRGATRGVSHCARGDAGAAGGEDAERGNAGRSPSRAKRSGGGGRGATLGASDAGRHGAASGAKKRPGRSGRPGRSLRFACSLARVRAYAFTAPYFERFSTSTAAIISTAPTTSAIHGLPVKPAMM